MTYPIIYFDPYKEQGTAIELIVKELIENGITEITITEFSKTYSLLDEGQRDEFINDAYKHFDDIYFCDNFEDKSIEERYESNGHSNSENEILKSQEKMWHVIAITFYFVIGSIFGIAIICMGICEDNLVSRLILLGSGVGTLMSSIAIGTFITYVNTLSQKIRTLEYQLKENTIITSKLINLNKKH